MTWQAHDIVVLILTGSVALAMLITILTPLFLKQVMTEERSKILSGIVLAIIAIISLYIGAKLQ